jgi:hypothetical protein
MDSTTEAIVSKLKEFKQQGLSYYQATQKLLQQGYTQLQIDDAEDSFNYNEASVSSVLEDELQDVPKASKPNIFTQNYSSHGELWYPGNSGVALLIFLLIVIALLVAWLTGAI